MEGLVAGLGRTTVVFTGDTESVVENLQLRQQKQKGRGGGREKRREESKRKKKWEWTQGRRVGGKYEHHKYSQRQHITITTTATVSSSFWCSLDWLHSISYPLSTWKYNWDQMSKKNSCMCLFPLLPSEQVLVGNRELLPNKLPFQKLTELQQQGFTHCYSVLLNNSESV